MKRYVIIGGGIAGINCVEGIRSLDAEGEITLISAEAESNYGRPLISYYLEGRTDRAHMSYRGGDFYDRNRVAALHGVSAEKIDPTAQTVTLSDGRVLPYDALCVAAGSRPFVPPFPGLDTVETKFSFMTLADARGLEAAVTPESRVLIVGAGLIGLKCAEGLRDRAKSITVCDLAPYVLSSILQPDSAAIVERHLARSGIELLLGDSAARFEGNVATMNSGKRVEFDVLVLAIGVRPNTALISDAGGAVNRGIIINDRMATTIPDIYAAGDCVESPDSVTGETGLIAILPNAARQGRVAGINMAGGGEVFAQGMRLNSIGFFGLHLMTAGSYDCEVYEEVDDTGCKKLFVKEGRLSGFIILGDVSRVGIYTALIREKRPLEEIDFDLVRKNPSLLPFGASYRAQKLGGVV